MRLWSVHPKYLDVRGLTALWREAILAQKVLRGKTKGYRHHPQLDRFKNADNPCNAIAAYLEGVWQEAHSRGYHYDKTKIPKSLKADKIDVSVGQLIYEYQWLLKKLKVRDPGRYAENLKVSRIKPHGLFKIIPGKVALWEKVSVKKHEKNITHLQKKRVRNSF